MAESTLYEKNLLFFTSAYPPVAEIVRARVYVARLYVRQRAFEDAELAIEGGVAELGISDAATLKVLAEVQLERP